MATAKKDSEGIPQEASKGSAAISAAASDALNQRAAAGADYIPCRFTDAQLKNLSAPEQVLTLSPADAEDLVSKVTATIQQQQQAGLISADQERELFVEITKTGLTGRTPSEALQLIIEATLSARTNSAPTEGGAKAPARKEDSVSLTTDPKTNNIQKVLNPGTETSQNMAAIVNSARDTIDRLSRPTDVGCAMSVLSYNETSRAYGYIIANNYIAVQVVVRNLNRDQQFVLHDVEYSVNTDPTGAIGRYYSGRDKVVVRSLASAEGSFDPRNLIVHTAQGIGAIMTTLVPIFGGAIGDAAAAYSGGFFPSLDKGWKDLSTDQLNLLNDTGFTSQSTSQTVVPKADKAMFVTFIPSKQFERGWWTLDCVKATPLGVLNKSGGRALQPLGANSKTASTQTYAPIDEAIRACAIDAYSKLNAKRKSRIGTAADSMFFTKDASFSAVEPSPDDIAKEKAAIQKCSDLESLDVEKLTDEQRGDLLQCKNPSLLFANVPKRIYRKWNGNSVALFQELSTVVIAGMHIVDDATLQPGVTSVDCTKDSVGNVVFPFPDTGTVACPIKGKNLAKVKALRLRNTDESAYTDGAVVASSGDDSTGTASFTSSALHALKKTEYGVALLNATNVETSTNQVLHFDLNPYLSKTDPPTLDLSKLPVPPNMTVTGFHLDKVGAVHFYLNDPTKFVSITPAADPASSDQQMKLPLDPTELAKLGTASADAKISILLTGSNKEIPLPNTIKFVPAAAAPAATAPATQKDATPAVKPH